jgi:hypothetical protein
MDDDHVIGMIGITGALQRRLKRWPPIISRGRTRLDVLIDDSPAIRQTVPCGQVALRGNRYLILRLPSGRDAQVNGGSQRRGGNCFAKVCS